MSKAIRTHRLNETHAIWAIVVLYFIGFALRIYDIDRLPLWYDEVIHLEWCRKLRLDLLWGATEIVEPFFSLLLYLVQRVSTADWWVRFHSVITGSLVPVVGFYMAKRIGGLRAGFMAMGLLVFAPLLVFYSRDAKEYALLALLELGLLAATIRYREEKQAHWTLALYVFLASAAVYTHILAPLFLAALNVAYLLGGNLKSRHFVKWLIVQAMVVFISIPFILAQFRFLRSMEMKFFWPPKPTWQSVVTSFENFMVGYAVSDWVRYIALAILLFATGWLLWRGSGQRKYAVFILATATGQMALLYVFSSIGFNSYYVDRFLIGSGMGVLTVAGLGLATISYRPLQYGLCLVLLFCMSHTLFHLYRNSLDPNWLKHVGVYSTFNGRGMAELLEDEHETGDVVWHLDHHLFVPIRWYSPELNHLRVDMGGRMRAAETLRAAASAENIGAPYQELEEAAKQAERVWVAFPGERLYLSAGGQGYLAWLEARGVLVDSYTFGGGGTIFPQSQLLLYDLSPDSEQTASGRRSLAMNANLPRGAVAPPKPATVTAELVDSDSEPDSTRFILFNTDSPFPQTCQYQFVAGDFIALAAGFERSLGEASDWKLQAFRDRESFRMALQTRVTGNTHANDRLRKETRIARGTYDVFVERIVKGKRYIAPTAELVIRAEEKNFVVAGAAADKPEGGWTWMDAGQLELAEDQSLEIELFAVDSQNRPEAHATFSQIVFVMRDEEATATKLPDFVVSGNARITEEEPARVPVPVFDHPRFHVLVSNETGSGVLRLPQKADSE